MYCSLSTISVSTLELFLRRTTRCSSSLYILSLGGCSNLELGIILKDALESLEHRGIHAKRILCGELMTSFNMRGFSLTVLKLTTDMSSTILNLLDAPTEAFAWPKTLGTTQLTTSIHTIPDTLDFHEAFTSQVSIEYPFFRHIDQE